MAKRKTSRAKKVTRKRKPVRAKKAKKVTRRKRSTRWQRQAPDALVVIPARSAALGPGTAGQSGDIEGLPGRAGANSESVRELAEEGQSFEAEVIDAVEGAHDPDEEEELRTRETLEDDVPREYDKER